MTHPDEETAAIQEVSLDEDGLWLGDRLCLSLQDLVTLAALHQTDRDIYTQVLQLARTLYDRLEFQAPPLRA